MDSRNGAILGLFFHLEIEKKYQSVKRKEIYGNTGLSSSKEL